MRLDWLELKVPPLAVTVVAAALTLTMPKTFGATNVFLAPVIAQTAGAIAAGIGLAVALWGVIAFRRAQTTVDPMHPVRSARLVTVGVYRWTRNPMYLGFVLLLVGLALALQSVPGIALAFMTAGYLHRFQIQPEERQLHQRFGADFAIYCARVRRWL